MHANSRKAFVTPVASGLEQERAACYARKQPKGICDYSLAVVRKIGRVMLCTQTAERHL